MTVTVTLPDADAYYLRLGPGRFQPTVHAQGAWAEHEQHMAPVSGLILHELQAQLPAADGMQVARVSFDILGMIHAVPTEIEVRTLRPGRTIELIEAVLRTKDRDTIRARVWRLATQDTAAVAVTEDAAMPPPQECTPTRRMSHWPGGYIASLEGRDDPAQPARPGRARTWLHTELPVVADEEQFAVARYVGLVDTANGVAPRHDPRTWMFPNTDLTIHFHRQPQGTWVGLDASVTWGATGLGVTSTVLHDELGPVGRAEQVLTVRPLPG